MEMNCPNCGAKINTANKIEVECTDCHYIIKVKDYKPIKEGNSPNLINLNEVIPR